MTIFESVYRFFGWWIINIDMLLMLLLLVGGLFFLLRKEKISKLLISISCVGFIFLSIVPVGFWMFENLENRFPKLQDIPKDTKGMILLGGCFDMPTSAGRGEVAYNLAGGNFIRFVELAHANPDLQLVYTGTAEEARLARQTFQGLGIDPAKVLFEGNSKNTFDNAQKTAALLQSKPDEKWVLVGSSYHIPRATGLFRKMGVNVIPFPVDYHTPGKYEMWFFIGLKLNLDAWHVAAREWLGLMMYYLMGNTSALYPAP